MTSLNPSQHRAVTHPGGPTLVLAGAGAGKTSVLTQRVAHLIQAGDVPADRILVVTFTNKAAKEMKERLAKLIGKTLVKTVWAGTFHSICCRILRAEIESMQLGLNAKFVIYDPNDQEKTMDTVLRKMNIDPKQIQASKMLYKISKLKNAGLTPLAAVSPEEALDLRIYAAYQQTLQLNNATDFDDLLLLTVRLLDEQPERAAYYLELFQHILVDEYQDTNTVQFELIRRLAQHSRNVFVVGDVDQSIYSFRHANFRIILRFQEDYPDATLIKLEENYRSTERILSAANDLIQHNQERFEKTLISTREPGEPLQFYQAMNEEDEASYIARQIQHLYTIRNRPYGHFAILYRTNAQSRLFEQKLVQAGIPYHVVGGFRFYDRKEIKDMLAYLHVLHNVQDSLSLKRILNTPKRGLGPKVMETIETAAYFEGRGLTLWQALFEEGVLCQLAPKARETIENFRDWLNLLMQQPLPVSQLLDKVYRESGYLQELDAITEPKKKEDKMANVEALLQATIEFEDKAKDPGDLTAFLERIALFSDTDQLKAEGNLVTLMTVHSAKGLEYPVVFIPGVEEGIFPHIRSIMEENPSAIEEERRLMYVALTRAKDQIYLIYATHRRNQRAMMSNKLSRFMLEISRHVQVPGELLIRTRQHLLEKKRFGSASGPFLRPAAAPALSPAPRPLPGPPPAPAAPKITLQAGDKVRHPQWGIGQVQKVIRQLAKISFQGQGEKNLDWTRTPLEKL